MSKPIYKLWMAKGKEAYYQLSEEERNALLERDQQSLEAHGIENIVIADCSWASEQWLFFGVQKFPSLEAVQGHAEDMMASEWFRYLDAKILFGTPLDDA